MMEPRIEHLPQRRFCVRRHIGPPEAVDSTRRAMYQHMISHELVGGPSALRHVEDGQRTEPLHSLDVLIGATCSFEGDDVVRVEVVPEGDYAVMEYEGPEEGVPAAIGRLRQWVADSHREPAGPVLQVHLMDPIDGVVEQELQVRLA